MKILHLIVHKKWFDMIASGVKKEEYREMTDYWRTRFIEKAHRDYAFHKYDTRQYDAVHFRNGYKADSPQVTLEFEGIRVGRGNAEWGAPEGEAVYIIKLGNILPYE